MMGAKPSRKSGGADLRRMDPMASGAGVVPHATHGLGEAARRFPRGLRRQGGAQAIGARDHHFILDDFDLQRFVERWNRRHARTASSCCPALEHLKKPPVALSKIDAPMGRRLQEPGRAFTTLIWPLFSRVARRTSFGVSTFSSRRP